MRVTIEKTGSVCTVILARFSTTAMWVYRLGAEKAKQMLFTGDLISGK